MIKIHFDPNENDVPTGVVSFASWEQLDLQDAIRKAFNESERENITDIYIDRRGIKALFDTRAACKV